MKLSYLLDELGKLEECEIYNEKEFQVFARITTCLKETRCIFLTDKKYIPLIPEKTTMVITTEAFKEIFLERTEGICICKNPKAIYFTLLNYIANKKSDVFKTIIGENCSISEQAYIAPFNVIIGDGVKIEEFASIYEGTKIGNDCVVHSGAKIGIQDYNFFKQENQIQHVMHQGKTILGNNVEVGFNSVIGRALYDYSQTYVGDSCKIGCNTSVGHDDRIGNNVMICANVVIGGHAVIRDNVEISIGVSIKNGVSVGENVHIDMGSVVVRDVESNINVFGNPARKIISPGK